MLPDDIIAAAELFRQRVASVVVPVEHLVPVWWTREDDVGLAPLRVGTAGGVNKWYVQMTCHEIPPGAPLPTGLRRSGLTAAGSPRYQYRLPNGQRPPAARVFFIDTQLDGLWDGWTVSHLSHNPGCLNPEHLALEPLDVNRARNGCPAGWKCYHQVRCIRPGAWYRYPRDPEMVDL